MAKNDWSPDDLLDFRFDHPAADRETELDEFDKLIESFEQRSSAGRSSSSGGDVHRGLDDSFDSYDEYKRYEELRGRSKSSAASFDTARHAAPRSEVLRSPAPPKKDTEIRIPKYEAPVYDIEPPISRHERPAETPSAAKQQNGLLDELFPEPAPSSREDDFFRAFDMDGAQERGMPEEATEARVRHSSDEIDAIKQASKDAIDRYRSNYTKNKKKKEGRAPVGKFHKWLTGIYAASLAVFVGSMVYMDVLPFGMLIALCVVLGLLSLVILVQTRKHSIQKWGKRLATFLAMLLIVFYGVGTAYALGTLSFLSSTSVENENAVANITRDPFNVVVTGIDVSGTIDEEGRSDVNMVLTVNPKTAQVLMTSIPRDYQINMPDKDDAMDKLTHTGFYSIRTTILAEEDLLDFKANYYVKVNFTTVEKFIDAIGGVDVYSEYEFVPVKMKDWTVKEGMNHMNGKQALAFARERKAFATGDNQRIKNQQAVFEAMFKKATSSRTMVFSYNKILANLKDYFQMSFSSRELRSLAKMQLAKNPDWKIYKNTIVGGDGLLPTYTAGGEYSYVMTRDEESISNAKALMNAVMNGDELAKDEDDNVYIVSGESGEESSEE